jgi:hypothetical protein
MFLPHENSDRWGAFFSQAHSVLKGNNVQDTPASNTDGIVSRDTCISSSQEECYLAQSEFFSHLKRQTDREYSFHMLN